MNPCMSKCSSGVCLSGLSSIKGLQQEKKKATMEREVQYWVPQKNKSAASDRVLSCFQQPKKPTTITSSSACRAWLGLQWVKRSETVCFKVFSVSQGCQTRHANIYRNHFCRIHRGSVHRKRVALVYPDGPLSVDTTHLVTLLWRYCCTDLTSAECGVITGPVCNCIKAA